MSKFIPRVAIIGMGGYAARHHEAVLALELRGECRLVSTCDPRPFDFAAQANAWTLNERGVAVHDDYRAMLDAHAGRLDLVIIPTPIPLHAEMHRAVIGRGLTVYLEKPPTLDPAELEEMIAQDASARVPTLVGFNFIGEPMRQALKRRLLAGEFGALREARLFGFWGRSAAYYGRSGWAAKLFGADDRLILDSCLGNGLSHHVHNLLHWAGIHGQDRWAAPTEVRASLWRAHPIEGADTCFLAAETDTGVPLRIAISHACRGPEVHREVLICDEAEIEYVTKSRVTVRWRDGREEKRELDSFDAQVENLRVLIECLRGKGARPPTTLADSRPFVHLHALAYLSARSIENFAEARIERAEVDGLPTGYLSVSGLAEQADQFMSRGEWPGTLPRRATPKELGGLLEAVRAMAAGAAVPAV